MSPLTFLLGKIAAPLRAHSVPGITLMDVEGRFIGFDLQADPAINGACGEWLYRETGGNLTLAIKVERIESHGAGRFTAAIRNDGADVRRFTAVQFHAAFDWDQADWQVRESAGGADCNDYPPTAYAVHQYAHLQEGANSHSIGGFDYARRGGSEKNMPILMVQRGSEADAPGFWFGLEWSGDWIMRSFARKADNCFGVTAHLMPDGMISNLTLDPEETLDFPVVHLGGFHGGFAGGTNSLRRYIYQHLQPEYLGERPYPRVTYDHWFGLGNEVNDEVMRRQVDRAAEMGVEIFCHDAGWFGDFEQDVGNWNEAIPIKYPDGLEPLADYVRSKGMQFGLWFECERAMEGSQALREHPEFFWPVPAGKGRKGNYHLNLARRDAQDWMIETISFWITSLGLRWSRLDYNIAPLPYWEAADPTGKIQFAYCQGLYRVLDVLRERHPEWMIENCASGGRRIDFGTIARSHTHWFSDHTHNAAICRAMQLRCQLLLPGNCPNTSVAVDKGQTDFANIDHEILSRATGKLAFDGDIASLNPAAAERCRFWVSRYKEYRHLLVQDFQQISPVPQNLDDWDVAAWSSYDRSEGLVAAYRFHGAPTSRWPLSFATAGAHYSVTDLGNGTSRKISGESLREGLGFDLPEKQSATLLHWKRD
ncbi:MAG: alpha-galactosidase [Verrucomicrobia bacterium]|nr:alpha-galactosidase [Verrucomicrobiota bacterium]